MDTASQSELIGTVLLIVIVAVATITIGVFFLERQDQTIRNQRPIVDVQVRLSSTALTVSHAGGDGFPVRELDLVLKRDGQVVRSYDLENHLTGASKTGGDGVFEPGERIAIADSFTGSYRILLIDTSRNGWIIYDAIREVA